jgi:hypothetical protein
MSCEAMSNGDSSSWAAILWCDLMQCRYAACKYADKYVYVYVYIYMYYIYIVYNVCNSMYACTISCMHLWWRNLSIVQSASHVHHPECTRLDGWVKMVKIIEHNSHGNND